MVYYGYLLLFVLLNLNFAKSCDEFQNFDKRFKSISKNDHLGYLISLAYYPVRNFVNFLPRLPQFCQINPFSSGEVEYKLSVRPLGCCNDCCIVDNADKHVRIKFVSKNKAGSVIKLSSEKKKGKLAAFGIKKELPTILSIHGFGENGFETSISKYITDAYLSRKEDYNFLLVDWGDLTAFPWYAEAVENTKLAAKALADFLEFYHKTGELPISNLHIIGISLGAHTAGHVGKMLKSVQKVPRITGLDAAFPFYSLTDKSERLCEDDAYFVDVIHTSPGFLGFPISIGHADFYPNHYKKSQPGCEFNTLVRAGDFIGLFACDHVRSVEFYAESVMNPKAFPVFIVDSQSQKRRFVKNAYMGFLANNSTTVGDLYLITNGKKPYGMSKD